MGERLKELGRKVWTDPSPRYEEELDRITKELAELEQERHDLMDQLERLLEAQKKELASLEEGMRLNWGRQYDLDKHITTLSTASIVGVAALSEFLPPNPALKSAAATSVVCFLVAIVLAIVAMFGDNMEITAVTVRDRLRSKGRIIRFAFWAMSQLMWVFRFGTPLAFCSGLLMIAKFVVGRA